MAHAVASRLRVALISLAGTVSVMQAPAVLAQEAVRFFVDERPQVQLLGQRCPGAERLAPLHVELSRAADGSEDGIASAGQEVIARLRGATAAALEARDLNAPGPRPTGRLQLAVEDQQVRVTFDIAIPLTPCRAIIRAQMQPARTRPLALQNAQALAEELRSFDAARSNVRGAPTDRWQHMLDSHRRITVLLGDAHAVAVRNGGEALLAAQDAGQLEAAQAFAQELLERARRAHGEGSTLAAHIRAASAMTSWRAGRASEAIATLRDALRELAEAGLDGTQFYQRRLRVLAQFMSLSGQQAEAIPLAEQAERLAAQQQGEGSSEHLGAVYALARVLLGAGQLQQTRVLVLRTLPMAAADKRSREYLDLVHALGIASSGLRLSDESKAAFEFTRQRSEELLGPRHTFTISSMVNLASERWRAREYDEAERLYLDALGRLPADGTRHEARASIPLSLANMALERGRVEAAGPWSERALETNLAYYGERDLRYADALLVRAEWLRRSGQLDSALDVIGRTDAIYVPLGEHGALNRLPALAEQARIFEARDQPLRAATLLAEVVAVAEDTRATGHADEGGRQQLLASRLRDYKALVRLRVRLGNVDGAFEVAELCKGRAMLDRLAEQRAFAQGGAPGLAQPLQAAAAELASLEAQLRANPTDVDLLASVANQRARYAALRAGIEAAEPRAALWRPRPIALPALQARLRPDEAALSYLLDEGSLVTFVVTAKTVQAFATDLTPEELQTLRQLAGRIAEPAPSAAGMKLDAPLSLASRVLLERAEPLLRGKRRVIVAPDGLLASIPFDLLQLGRRPLVEQGAVVYAQSLTILAWQREQPAASASAAGLLSLGAPDFDGPGTPPGTTETGLAAVDDPYRRRNTLWSPLPAARREVERVAKLFPGATVLLGEAADEAAVHAMNADGRLARFRYLHFATHAYYAPDRPDLSAVVLRQPPSPPHDGYLTAGEVAGLRLGSDLAVLSACETAAGQVVDGEGVKSFAFALLMAGSRATLAALWKVPDEATERLVVSFFAQVQRGLSYPEALAVAKRDLRRNPRFADPLHWAGFVLYAP